MAWYDKSISTLMVGNYGIAKQMGDLLIDELRKLGNTGVAVYLVQGVEEDVYQSIGMTQNTGHSVFVLDERPYVKSSENSGTEME